LFQDPLQHEEISNRRNYHDSGGKKLIFAQATLNNFAALPQTTSSAIYNRIIGILQNEHSTLFSDPVFNHAAFHRQKKCTNALTHGNWGLYRLFLLPNSRRQRQSAPPYALLPHTMLTKPSVHTWLAPLREPQPTFTPSQRPTMGEAPPSSSVAALCIDPVACCESLPSMNLNSAQLGKWTTNWSWDSSSPSLLGLEG
jgi:hypothetical protein